MTSEPRRVQLRRTKGWKMPPNTVSVARPTRWGNPYCVGAGMTAADAVHRYRGHLRTSLAGGCLDLTELRGRNLACWCPLESPCHADELEGP